LIPLGPGLGGRGDRYLDKEARKGNIGLQIRTSWHLPSTPTLAYKARQKVPGSKVARMPFLSLAGKALRETLTLKC
jgi:hypothetical protein